MTIAKQISKELDNDGQKFETDDGRTLDYLCWMQHTRCYGQGIDVYRYVFPDGSVITVCGDAWDFGYAGCFCFQSVGHEACRRSR